MNLNLNAKNILGINNEVFMPHISLIYGNHDMETREKIAAEIKLSQVTFMAKALTIIAFDPNITNWPHLATIPF